MSAGEATAGYRTEPLGAGHDRSGFHSGAEALDRYLRAQAAADTRRRIAASFVLVAPGDSRAHGYYTLCATSLLLSELGEETTRRLPRHPTLPAVLMARLAVDHRVRGRGLGEHLLLDALARTLRAEVVSDGFLVDAKDTRAESFYQHYGFRRIVSARRRLYIPMSEVAAVFS